ncbi:hypothetical protein L3i20_v229440 [Paenibacillus sp. L3-i20]|nr:hypothetical protein L3i20_v229440 [Paenibacillus sp. L3-i20]
MYMFLTIYSFSSWTLDTDAINLLYPSKTFGNPFIFSDQDFKELELTSIIHALDADRKHANQITTIS